MMAEQIDNFIFFLIYFEFLAVFLLITGLIIYMCLGDYIKKGEKMKNKSYLGKCGSCVYFKYGELPSGKRRARGVCSKKRRVLIHDASQKACKLYLQGKLPEVKGE